MEELEPRVQAADLLVLNGDTFDFRWSRLRTEAESIRAATGWLEALLDGFRGDAVHYVVGNHDCLAGFRTRLAALQEACPRLQCHDLHLRIGRSLFLHGDCANRRMDETDLVRHREEWSRDRPRGGVNAALYGAADALGVTKGFHRCYFPAPRSARRVAHYLDRAVPAWRTSVDDCYFGHTHVPFSGHVLGGIRFHNTGSGIRGMGFRPMHFQAGPTGPETSEKDV